ncbi:MAG: hypothetical protein IPH60_15235 [Flavobacteriales bacterium]|nr:hypothetical protein [Flavobacteriales bacterium]
MLVFIDAEPRYQAVEQRTMYSDPICIRPRGAPSSRGEHPFLLVRPSGGDHYLYGSDRWFTSSTIMGPGPGPIPFHRNCAVGETSGYNGLAVGIQVRWVRHGSQDGGAHHPAVLLDLDGPPQFQPLPGTALQYATNTEDDSFLDVASQDTYLLASGRWFATHDPKTGPWRYVPADALACGVQQDPGGPAKDGAWRTSPEHRPPGKRCVMASIPQTAQVDRTRLAFRRW